VRYFLLLLLCVFLAAPAHSRPFSFRALFRASSDIQEPARDPESVLAVEAAVALASGTPYFRGIAGSDNSTDIRDRGTYSRNLLLSSIELMNPGRVRFLLLLSFENGGALRHRTVRSGRGVSIRLEDIELRYLLDGVEVARKLAREPYNSNGRFYEVLFSGLDLLQDVYRIEIWATLNQEEFQASRHGAFFEVINLNLEVPYR